MGLPQPAIPYESFEAFLSAAIEWGRENPDPAQFSRFYALGHAEIQQDLEYTIEHGFRKPLDLPQLRGSSNLSCQGITSLTQAGEIEVESIPPGRHAILRMGHILHAEMYGRLCSGLPDWVGAMVELPLVLPEWWPHDLPCAAEGGTADLVLTIPEAMTYGSEAAKWFAPGTSVPTKMICDVKSTSTFLFPKYTKADINDPAGDLYGYVSQISLYSAVIGSEGHGGALLFINRDQPSNPALVKYISPDRIKDEVQQIKRRVAAGTTFVPEKAQRFSGRDIEKVCGNWRTGAVGYCKFSEACMERRKSHCDF